VNFVIQKASKQGEQSTLQNQVNTIYADYQTDYKDAGKRFYEGQIRLKTTKAANEDLGKYQGALDK